MPDPNNYVRTDEHGVMRVGETRISLDSVVIAFDEGAAPETIVRNYPALNLEQVYGAIAYYLGHRQEVQDYLRRNREEWDRLRAEAERNPNSTVERLRAILRERAGARQ